MTEADRTLNQNIRKALSADSALVSSATNVHFNTDNGTVTLQGTVATAKDKENIEAKVEKLTGVKDVNNQLQVASSTSHTTESPSPSRGK
jgi:osmotically-inducible protein OsmY